MCVDLDFIEKRIKEQEITINHYIDVLENNYEEEICDRAKENIKIAEIQLEYFINLKFQKLEVSELKRLYKA